MRGTKAKRLRKLGLKSGPAPRPKPPKFYIPGPGFDHAKERRSRHHRAFLLPQDQT